MVVVGLVKNRIRRGTIIKKRGSPGNYVGTMMVMVGLGDTEVQTWHTLTRRLGSMDSEFEEGKGGLVGYFGIGYVFKITILKYENLCSKIAILEYKKLYFIIVILEMYPILKYNFSYFEIE